MKRTQRTDAFRNIQKYKASYISILVIVLLATNAFLCVLFAAEDMRREMSGYYDRLSFWDIEITSTLLMDDGDLQAILDTEGVADAEALWRTDAVEQRDSKQYAMAVISLTERINLPELLSGRLPETPMECAVEEQLAERLDLSVGDVLTLRDKLGETPQGLIQPAFEITGIVHYPDRASDESDAAPCVLVQQAAFDREALGGCFMKALIRVKNAPENRYTEEYLDTVTPVQDRLKALGEIRAPLRSDAVRSEREARLEELRAMYAYAHLPVPDELAAASDDVGDCRWIVLNDRSNQAYMYALESADNLGTFGYTFALMFLMIAVLIIFTSITQMIEEQKSPVGVLKATGISNRELIVKYLAFGVSSCLIGLAAGLLLGWLVFQRIALALYSGDYYCRFRSLVFLPGPAAAVFFGILGISILTVSLACLRLMRASSLELIENAPNIVHLRTNVSNSSKSLYLRLILLNLRSRLKEVTVTVVSVAGCCILLMIGFALNYGHSRVIARQCEEIQPYDQVMFFDTEVSPTAESDLAAVIRATGAEYMPLCCVDTLFQASDSQNPCTLMCMDPDLIGDFFILKDCDTGAPMDLPQEGVLVVRRFPERFDLGPGDCFTVYDGDLQPHDVVIAGVFNNYLAEKMLLSPAYWETVFGEAAVNNCFYIKMNGGDADALRTEAARIPGFVSMDTDESLHSFYISLSAVFTALNLGFIVMAGLMAYFILVNLSNIYMAEKRQELRIMRINGFTVRECVLYAGAEICVTTIAGILLGLAVGAWLGYRILLMMEIGAGQFAREPDVRSFLFSALITGLFSLVINGLALRRIKSISLIEE